MPDPIFTPQPVPPPLAVDPLRVGISIPSTVANTAVRILSLVAGPGSGQTTPTNGGQSLALSPELRQQIAQRQQARQGIGPGQFGGRVQHEAVIEAGSYTRRLADGSQQTFEYPELRIPDPQVRIGGSKSLQVTDLVQGYFIEDAQSDRLTATVSGYIVSDDLYSYPVAEVQALRSLLASPEPFTVRGQRLEAWGFREVKITSWDVPASQWINVQAVALTLMPVFAQRQNETANQSPLREP